MFLCQKIVHFPSQDSTTWLSPGLICFKPVPNQGQTRGVFKVGEQRQMFKVFAFKRFCVNIPKRLIESPASMFVRWELPPTLLCKRKTVWKRRFAFVCSFDHTSGPYLLEIPLLSGWLAALSLQPRLLHLNQCLVAPSPVPIWLYYLQCLSPNMSRIPAEQVVEQCHTAAVIITSPLSSNWKAG